MTQYVGALDQGTTSTRFMVFDRAATRSPATSSSTSRSCRSQDGSSTIRSRSRTRTQRGDRRARSARRPAARDLAAIGVTNQRETTVVWDPKTGRPWYNAIVWQDTRTDRIVSALDVRRRDGSVRARTGLPPATYFSGAKIQWILENVDGVRAAAARGEAVFGTIDTLGDLEPDRRRRRRRARDRRHQRQPDNADGPADARRGTTSCSSCSASRARCCPRSVRRRSASYGVTRARRAGRRRSARSAAILGDQQAATVGQVCIAPGEAKNTYGTGNFMLLNTGTQIGAVEGGAADDGLLQAGRRDAIYALEGSIAVTGSAVQWLRDQLGIIKSASEIEALAASVDDTGGVYFVPAFSGLFAPYWRSDARGAIVGLSRFNNRGTSRARRSRRSASRRAPCSTRWWRTPASRSSC